MGTNRVEEVTVVTYHQHGMFKIRKVFLKPGHSIHIQVIGRLVEQQIVRISKQGLCQHHTHLFLTAEVSHQHAVLVFLNAQSAQQNSCIAFGIPAFQLSKFLFQLCSFDTVFIRKIFLRIKRITLFHDIPENRVSHQHGVKHRMGIKLKVVLTQHGQTLARSQGYASLGRIQFT